MITVAVKYLLQMHVWNNLRNVLVKERIASEKHTISIPSYSSSFSGTSFQSDYLVTSR